MGNPDIASVNLPLPQPVPKGYAKKVCKAGDNKTQACVFLFLKGRNLVFSCAKTSNVEAIIRDRIAKGISVSKCDNCSGPPNYNCTDAKT